MMMSQNLDYSSQLVSPEEQILIPVSIFCILTQESMMNWTRQLLRFFLKQLIFLLATISQELKAP